MASTTLANFQAPAGTCALLTTARTMLWTVLSRRISCFHQDILRPTFS